MYIDKRFEQESVMRPYATALYREVFAGVSDIVRKPGSQQDKAGVDAILKIGDLPDNLCDQHCGEYSLQEKFLSYEYAKFATVTIEYEQNQYTHEKGDWFTMNVDYYFVGYINEQSNGFIRYIFLDWKEVRRLTEEWKIAWQFNKNKNGKARASFMYAHFRDFPPSCVLKAVY